MASTGASAQVIRANGVPFYIQVADYLRGELRAGRWQTGEVIPAEAALCDMFGVSRTAIRQALAELVKEGRLQKERGRGTFVSRPHVTLAVRETRGFFDEMVEKGHSVETTVLRQAATSVPPELAPLLGVPMNSPVLCIERSRAVGDETLVYVTTYMPMPRFTGLVERDLSKVSLYGLLLDEFAIQADSGRRKIEAVRATAKVAKRLGIRTGEPTLLVTAVNYDARGEAFEVFEAFYRADRAAFEVDVVARTSHAR